MFVCPRSADVINSFTTMYSFLQLVLGKQVQWFPGVVQEKQPSPKQSDLLLHLPEMNACFGQNSVEDIHASLKQLNNDWSKEALKLING